MVTPGRYNATATDSSGETIIIRVEGSEIRAASFDYPNAKLRGLSTVYTDDGRLMTAGSQPDTVKLVGGKREYKIGARV